MRNPGTRMLPKVTVAAALCASLMTGCDSMTTQNGPGDDALTPRAVQGPGRRQRTRSRAEPPIAGDASAFPARVVQRPAGAAVPRQRQRLAAAGRRLPGVRPRSGAVGGAPEVARMVRRHRIQDPRHHRREEQRRRVVRPAERQHPQPDGDVLRRVPRLHHHQATAGEPEDISLDG